MKAIKHTSVRRHSYPAELGQFELFADSSWGNDITDSVVLVAGGRALTVWIDHETPSERSADYWDPDAPISESNMPPRRFIVCALVATLTAAEIATYGAMTVREILDDRQIADAPPLLETDDPDALLAFLRGLSQAELLAHGM